jgi:hypothetical protein
VVLLWQRFTGCLGLLFPATGFDYTRFTDFLGILNGGNGAFTAIVDYYQVSVH